jgi:hypothetical protein
MDTPVLFIIFNRPETTRKVFEAIRQAKPTRLYITADGPRDNKPGEFQRCEEARHIATQVDWDCHVQTLFREKNVGCGKAVSSGITWFFENETEGIILEDDCLPSVSFFRYCSELLERYRNDTRIMGIGANNFERAETREREYSYTFSSLAYIWGWATWKRAWQFIDLKVSHYPELRRKNYLDESYDTLYKRDFFNYIFGELAKDGGKINHDKIWGYQWQFACMVHAGLTIVPNCSLVSNIGMGADATHTTDSKSLGYDLKREEIVFPLQHPEFVMIDHQRDTRTFNLMHTSALSRFKSNVKRMIPASVMEKVLKPLMYMFL